MDQYIEDTEPVYGVINYIGKNVDCQNKWKLQLLQMVVEMIGKKGPFKLDITSLVQKEMTEDQTVMYIGQKDIPLTPKDALEVLKGVDECLAFKKEKEFVNIVQTLEKDKYRLDFKEL